MRRARQGTRRERGVTGGRWQSVRGMAAVAVLASCTACSHTGYYQVRRGDTLYRISQAYGVSVEQLAQINGLSDPSRLEVGQRLRIPGAGRELPVDVITPRATSDRPLPRSELLTHAPVLSWPVAGGTVTSPFGQRGESVHDGIDISAPLGTPVHAAQDGEVIYSDSLRGYGNLIIVRHVHEFATVYAHNRRNLVQVGQHVRQGEVIADVGASGHTTGASLHFEVRKDNVACDPLFLLPPSEQVAVRRVSPGG